MSKSYLIQSLCSLGKYFLQSTKAFEIKIMPWYAVRRGQNPGLYTTWDECQKMVKGFPNASFKKFNTISEAEEFLKVDNYSYMKRKLATNTLKNKKIKLFQKTLSNVGNVMPQSNEENIKLDGPLRDFIDVYVDGCCFSNGQTGAKAGIGVFWGPQNPKNISEPLYISHPSKLLESDKSKGSTSKDSKNHMISYQKPTNNLAEIKAAHLAILQAKEMKINNLAIHSDSELLINSITKWLPKWESSGWKTSCNKPVKNSEELKALYQDLKDGINIKWVHVRGHSGIPGNEAADTLAKRGAEMKPKS